MFANPITRVALLCLPVAFAILYATSAAADEYDQYEAALYRYFSRLDALPIRTPQGEEPGDVYVTPGGQIFARRKTCFDELSVSEHDTVLARVLKVGKSDVRSRLDVEAGPIADAAAKLNIRFGSAAHISYGHPNGHPKIKSLEHFDVLTVLTQRPDGNACRDHLRKILRTNPGDNIEKGVPWIIATVWYASANISVATAHNVDADAQAKFQKSLSEKGGTGIKAAGNIEAGRSGDRLVVVNTEKTAFPVAWQPAFISSKHFEDMRRLREKVWFRRARELLGFEKSMTDILAALRAEFDLNIYKEVPPPQVVDRDISMGSPIGFDAKDPKHLEYLQDLNAIYSLSWQAYGKKIQK
jgi:hypothetical protein